MKLLDLYTSVLAASGRTVEPGGYISINSSLFTGADKNDPALLDGKRLVLPTREHLTDSDRATKIIFHPLSENILRGESPVVANLRAAFTVRINYTIAAVGAELLEICASINKHRTLSPDQASLLSIAPNCDEDTVRVFSSLLIKALSDDSKFVKLYLKRSGVVNGVKYSRAGIVSFPFYEELKEAKDSLYGIKLRKKDREIILKLMEFILPNIDKEEAYNAGSDSTVAPFTDALMKTFLGIASKLNDVLELYKDKVPDFEKLIFDSDWVEDFEDLTKLQSEIRLIPPQAGNEGDSKKSDQPTAITPTQQLQYTAPVANQPLAPNPVAVPVNVPANSIPQMSQPAPAVSSSGKVKFSDLVNHNPAMAYSVQGAPIPPSLMADMRPQMPPGVMPGMGMPGMGMPGIPPGMTPEQAYAYQQWVMQQQAMQQQYQGGYPAQYPPQMYPQQMPTAPGAPRTMSSVMPHNPVMSPMGGGGFYRGF